MCTKHGINWKSINFFTINLIFVDFIFALKQPKLLIHFDILREQVVCFNFNDSEDIDFYINSPKNCS